MTRLTERVALIGGPAAGAAGDPDDCNVYAVATSVGTVLIDAGVGRGVDQLLSTADGDGVELTTVAALLLTHAHLDHAGGAALLHERLRAPVIAAAETARRVADADEESISLPAARRAGMYRPTDRLRACPIARIAVDSEPIAIGDVRFTPLATPGHSADHTAYVLECDGWVALLAGDLLFPEGQVALLNTHDCSLRDLVASLERLRGLSFDALLAGHLQPVLSGAQRDRDAALARLDDLAIPRSIV